MKHLRKQPFGEEHVAWCGTRSYRDEDMPERPEEVGCKQCLEAAYDFGRRASRRRTIIKACELRDIQLDHFDKVRNR